ncbi:MAG TPA: beta-propeller domain-containing protein [Gemmatimonadaceae bacterium]|nr:beta-propeller domain-containing protein [Gemmatimonadaceae bacterium]
MSPLNGREAFIARAVRCGLLLQLIPVTFASAQHPSTLSAFRTDAELASYLRQAIRAEAARRAAWTPPPPPACKNEKVSVQTQVSKPDVGPAMIHGRVRPDGAGTLEGLQEAMISILPLSLTAMSATDGSFSVTIPAQSFPDSLRGTRPVTLLVRRVGYTLSRTELTLHRGDRVDVDVPLCAATVQLESVVTTGAATDESITNTQHEGVDEGGIVKRLGDYLVVLRRGRLFTIDVSRGRLRPVSASEAYGPGIDPSGTWYDEMLVSGDKVVVIGYSYDRGGTEIGVFNLDPGGQLRHRGTYNLRSNDYYSSRDYASRLVGDHLVFYSPFQLSLDSLNPLASLPSMRRWVSESGSGAFRRIANARQVYRVARQAPPSGVEVMHSVTSCDLAAPELKCESTVVLGPGGSVFYVSPTAVYVSAAPWRRASSVDTNSEQSLLFRMPLDGSAPSALRIAGSPIDQFSFLEENGQLNVLLSATGRGDRMWSAERHGGTFALLQLAIARFGDGTMSAPRAAYRMLPAVGIQGTVHNRFVGEYLLYGGGNGWWRPRTIQPSLTIVPINDGAITQVVPEHGIDRIEVMGRDAVVVGSDSADVHFTAIHLAGAPALGQQYTLQGASQGELRSHGFFYKPESSVLDAGTIGLPVRRAGRPGYEHLFQESAAVFFLASDGSAFQPLGTLEAHPDAASEDECKASCIDWYGNARPLFFEGRVLALLGYELVEGQRIADQIVELRRVDFARAGADRKAEY